jgi:MscS family membrane protein
MNHGSLPAVSASRDTRRFGLRVGVGAVALLATLLTTPAATATEPGELYPLEPPARSSPRATIATLLESIDDAIELHKAGDPKFRRSYATALRCVDPARLVLKAPRAVGEAALQLKEVLDRIELPPEDQIPDARWVRREGLVAWRIPHTEIELVRVDEGDQAGEFLFSARTVERVAEFYEHVRHLPYRAGKLGASYEEFRFGTESRLVGTIVARLPAWAKREVAGQLLWQWAALVLLVILAAVLTGTALRIGRKHTRPVAHSHGLNRLWALVGPVTLVAVALWARKASFDYLRIWGATGTDFRIAMTAVAYFGAAWLTAVLVTRGAEHIILAGRIERPLSQQLIRVSSRALALLLVVGWIFVGGQRLGVPLAAMVAGLGVGGLAVALAAQSTIENLIGGISLFADQPVRIGDTLRLGDRVGTLEEVGLRSAKIRTRENTIITVPNAEFAKLELENFSRKDKSLVPSSATC